MTAPVFQAAGSAVSGTGATSVPWPAYLAGDIALLVIEHSGNGSAATLSLSAGFTLLGSIYSGGSLTDNVLTVYWRRATGAGSGGFTSASPSVNAVDHVTAQILTFRGCIASGNPWDVFATGAIGTSGTSPSAPAITTTVADTLVVAIVSRGDDSAAAEFSGWTNADLASLVEITDFGTTAGNGGGIGAAAGRKAAAGAVAATTATSSVASQFGAMTVALKPPVSLSSAFFAMF